MGETPSFTGEFVEETHRVLECIQAHPPRNQRQKGPICLWVVGEVTENWQREEQVALFPCRSLPHIQHHNTAMWVAPPWRIPKALAPNYITGTLRQKKKMAQMKKQIKTPEKIQLINEDIANPSDTEFKILVIRMLTELVEYSPKIEEEMKAMQSEIKENV